MDHINRSSEVHFLQSSKSKSRIFSRTLRCKQHWANAQLQEEDEAEAAKEARDVEPHQQNESKMTSQMETAEIVSGTVIMV